jgi:hypothetical protein
VRAKRVCISGPSLSPFNSTKRNYDLSSNAPLAIHNPSLPYAVPIRASCRGNIISDSKCPTNPQSSRLAPRYLAHEANALRGSRVEGPSGVESNGAAHVAPAVVARSWWKFWMRKTRNGCKPALCSTSRGRCTAKLISSARPCNSKEN